MPAWFRRTRKQRRKQRPSAQRNRLTIEGLEDRRLFDAGGFVQTALASSVAGLAPHMDSDLINPWGFSETPQGQFRISANGAGNAPLLNAQGAEVGKALLLPPPLGSAPGTLTTPNGQVVNNTSDFVISLDGRSAPADVIFSTEDGTLIGFNPQVDSKQGILVADQSASGAVYKLLAADTVGTNNFLYATDFHNNKIDVFDKNFAKVTLGTGDFGTFTDPNELAGFAPFGIKNIGGDLFVSYAKQKAPDNHDDQEGPGNGFIDEFDNTGHFLKRFATGGTLNSPIGMAIAPAGFGRFGGDLLVGNFGDSRVSAFDPNTGVFLGQLTDPQGNPLVLNGGFQEADTKGLWGIGFGNGAGGSSTNTLYFAAGINDESDGLFGKVTFAPPPANQPAPVVVQTNLTSDLPGMAAQQDPLLINPWGISFGPTTPFWVSDNATGFSTLYNGQGVAQPAGTNPPISPLQVTIPSSPGSSASHGTPTGTVFNTDHAGFNVSETVDGATKTGSSAFLFDTLDGTISGWSPGVDRTHAIVAVNMPGSVFTGLAQGVDSAGDTLLYAADHAKGTIDVFDQNFNPVTTLPGSFQDPNLPAGAAPFNVQNIAGDLYVEYTVPAGGEVHGAVDVFTTDGTPVNPMHPLIVGGSLVSPWGVTLAPAGFGQFSNDLLVGNFGNGQINAFDPKTGDFLGTLTLPGGQPFVEDHLWALMFGNGASTAANTLYFTAGINNEKDGLFGSLQAVPTVAHQAPVLTSLAAAAQQTISTVPANGDVNPYGVAFVPQDIQSGGVLQPGDLLVSNFNNSSNVQGTGSTIVRITADGQRSVFFQGSPAVGLTTALAVLKSGFVVVGNVPTDADGVAQPGSLLILDSNGNLVSTLSDSALLDGPWDLAVNDAGNHPQLFVSNVLSGTITRIDLVIPKGGTPQVERETQIGSGYTHRTDPNALVVGPTGLAFDPKSDTLYVASTGDNAIYAIKDAAKTSRDRGTGRVIFNDSAQLHGPLGLVLAPNGDLIIANGDAVNPDPNHANELVEITTRGKFVDSFQLDGGPAGAAFGLAVTSDKGVLRFAAVDDVTNAVDIWSLLRD
ncbi:MAG TPA: TIGR03118 family protein [Pirellulales bacterium]|nr:TIGR03118 family protein [Pirellulales bacterium]